jgi:hypothetical protein
VLAKRTIPAHMIAIAVQSEVVTKSVSSSTAG